MAIFNMVTDGMFANQMYSSRNPITIQMHKYEYEYENSEIKSDRLRYMCGLFEDVQGLAVDDVGGFVYWVDDYKTIKQASLDGSNTTTILTTGRLSVIRKRLH